MPDPQYVFKPSNTEIANIKKEICAFIVNICSGSQIISAAPAAEPFAIGDIRMTIILKNPCICIVADNPALARWFIKASMIVKMYPEIANIVIVRKGPMKDKMECVANQIQRIRMQDSVMHSPLIVDTINLFKHAGWYTNATDDANFNFARIYRLPRAPAFKRVNTTGTRWDLLYRLGVTKTKPKAPPVPNGILIVGDNRLKYTPRCPHALEGLFLICWVSHINTPLAKLPPGDGYCLACSENIKNYEQVAIMDLGLPTPDYLKSIGIVDEEYISVILDLLMHGRPDDTGNVLVGKEWNFLHTTRRIYSEIQSIKTSRYIGTKVVLG